MTLGEHKIDGSCFSLEHTTGEAVIKRAVRQFMPQSIYPPGRRSKSSRKVPGGEAMLKSSSAEQNAKRAKQAANYGMAWMRQFMDESLNQTRAIFDGFLTTARKTADGFDQQAAEVRERSMSMATDTLSNSMDFAHRALNVRQPQDPLAVADRIRDGARIARRLDRKR